MKKLLLLLPALLLLAGCRTPERFTQPFAVPADQVSPEEQERRAAELSEITRQDSGSAVVINFGNMRYPELLALDEAGLHREVIRRAKLCGFKLLVCQLTSEVQLNEQFARFLHAAGEAQLPVSILISQEDFYRVNRINFLIRLVAPQYPDLKKMAELTVKFNSELPERDRLAGIMVLPLPHFCDGRNSDRLYGKLYCWNEDRYGIGGDNDMLMRETYRNMKELAAIPGLPPLTLAIADFYHDRAAAGQLSVGTVSDWAKITPRLAILNLSSRPTGVAKGISGELIAAPEGTQIFSLVRSADHVSTAKDALRRRDWKDLIAALRYAARRNREYPVYGGMILSPFSVLEMLRLSASADGK